MGPRSAYVRAEECSAVNGGADAQVPRSSEGGGSVDASVRLPGGFIMSAPVSSALGRADAKTNGPK